MKEVKEQFGKQIDPSIEILFFDFDGHFENNEHRFVNVMKQYTQRSVRLLNGISVLSEMDSLAEASGRKWFFVDDAIGEKAKQNNNKFRAIELSNLLDDMKEQFKGIDVSAAKTHATSYDLIEQAVTYGQNDWYSNVSSKVLESGKTHWVLCLLYTSPSPRD